MAIGLMFTLPQKELLCKFGFLLPPDDAPVYRARPAKVKNILGGHVMPDSWGELRCSTPRSSLPGGREAAWSARALLPFSRDEVLLQQAKPGSTPQMDLPRNRDVRPCRGEHEDYFRMPNGS